MRPVVVALPAIASARGAGAAAPTATGPASPIPTEASPSSPAASAAASTRPSGTGGPGATDEAGGAAFGGPEGAYRITVPDEWVANHGAFVEGVESWFTGPAEGGFRPNVKVLTHMVGDMDLGAYGALAA